MECIQKSNCTSSSETSILARTGVGYLAAPFTLCLEKKRCSYINHIAYSDKEHCCGFVSTKGCLMKNCGNLVMTFVAPWEEKSMLLVICSYCLLLIPIVASIPLCLMKKSLAVGGQLTIEVLAGIAIMFDIWVMVHTLSGA